MTRREYEELQRKLSRARRLALEPADALSRERAVQVIEDLEYQLRGPAHRAGHRGRLLRRGLTRS
jgi:hypothetical protein